MGNLPSFGEHPLPIFGISSHSWELLHFTELFIYRYSHRETIGGAGTSDPYTSILTDDNKLKNIYPNVFFVV